MTNVERQKRKYLKRVYSQCLNVCNHENEGRFKTSLLERLSIINVAKSKVVDKKRGH